MPLRVVVLRSDFECVFEEQASEWLEELGLREGEYGGVLVRPDQHILSVLNKNKTAEELATELNEAAGY